jgi:hypothetical protein
MFESPLNGKMLGMVVLAYHPNYGRKCKIGELWRVLAKK